jgi:hypothetical protein
VSYRDVRAETVDHEATYFLAVARSEIKPETSFASRKIAPIYFEQKDRICSQRETVWFGTGLRVAVNRNHGTKRWQSGSKEITLG